MTPDEVRALRLRFGWTQRALAAELHVTVTTVSRWEQGARAITPFAARALALLTREFRPPKTVANKGVT